MALFTKKIEPTEAPPAFSPPRPQAAAATPGEAAAECMRVGQLLVDGDQLAVENLAIALSAANGDLLQFADIVLGRFTVGRAELTKAIAEVTEVHALDSKAIALPDNAKDLLDEKIVRAHCVIAIAEEDGAIVVIAADPSPARRKAVEAAAGRPVRWTVADPATIRTFIDRTYRADDEIERLVKGFEVGDDQSKVAAAAAEVSLDDQAPIIQLVSRIVSQALRDRTSDIHVEPLDERLRIRFRIDGHLVEAFSLPISVHPALSSRLKIMSGMNIVEKRKPQDGQFSTVIDGKEVDVRVASVATVFGEPGPLGHSLQESTALGAFGKIEGRRPGPGPVLPEGLRQGHRFEGHLPQGGHQPPVGPDIAAIDAGLEEPGPFSRGPAAQVLHPRHGLAQVQGRLPQPPLRGQGQPPLGIVLHLFDRQLPPGGGLLLQELPGLSRLSLRQPEAPPGRRWIGFAGNRPPRSDSLSGPGTGLPDCSRR